MQCTNFSTAYLLMKLYLYVLGRPCPNLSCDGILEIQPCRGHCGYPVTHFWRHVPSLGILFQVRNTIWAESFVSQYRT